jgi:hypothetical protein
MEVVHKNIKHQEKLFYEKLTDFEEDYIESIFNNNNDNIHLKQNTTDSFADKLKDIQDLILELIEFQRTESSQGSMNRKSDLIDDGNLRETQLKDLFKKIKKLSKAEGGFLFMPFRTIFYNFYLNYKNRSKAEKDSEHQQADYLLKSSIVIKLFMN